MNSPSLFALPRLWASAGVPPAAPASGNASDLPSGAAGGAGEGGGGKKTPPPAFHIAEARKAVAKGNIRDALLYLEAIAGASIKKSDNQRATACLDEAERIVLQADSPDYFAFESRFATLNSALGRAAEAEAILSRVLSYIPITDDPSRRDGIRTAAVLTWLEMGKIEEALQLSDQMEGYGIKWSAYKGIVKKLAGDDAERCLLERCLPIALAFSERYSKLDGLIGIAQDLIEIGKGKSAELILDEVDRLKTVRDNDKAFDKLWKQAARMLINLGRPEKALLILNSRCLDREHPTFVHNPGELRRAMIEDIRPRYPEFVTYFETKE